MNKLIITVAATGAWPTKKNNPNVPITPKEIADSVYESYKAGASIAHLHMRDKDENGTMDKDLFAETVKLIKERCDIVINLTTSGELGASDERRYAHLLEIKPDMASFDCGSMNWMHSGVFLNSPKFLEKLATVMNENNIKPEIECFDAGMIYNAMYYMKKGLIEEPAHFQICLGAAGGSMATVENLIYLKNLLPVNSTWSAFGTGSQHLPIVYATLALGGHLRVGMEDNVYYSKGVLAESNAEFVERAVRLGKEFGREIASPKDAREMLNLNK